MRYALRNQDKIIKVHSKEVLDCIIKSLDEHFKKENPLNDLKETSSIYKLLIINDVEHTVNCIVFYVLEQRFNIARLAFKEFVG